MEGGELFHQIVKLTYFSESLSRHVIRQVADGIRYLHEERGVVHRYVISLFLRSAPANRAGTSNPKTFSLIASPSFLLDTLRTDRTTKRKRTKGSIDPASVAEALAASRSPTLACRRLYGMSRQ